MNKNVSVVASDTQFLRTDMYAQTLPAYVTTMSFAVRERRSAQPVHYQ